MYEVRLVMPSRSPASSSSHFRMLFMLCPLSRAASISGQSALIWPALVAGFSAQRSARRKRTRAIQSCGFSASCTPDRKIPPKYYGTARGRSGRANTTSCSLARAEESPLNDQGNSERPSGRLNDFSLVRLPRGKLVLYLNKEFARERVPTRKLEKLHALSRTLRLRRIATVHGRLRRFPTFRRLCDR